MNVSNAPNSNAIALSRRQNEAPVSVVAQADFASLTAANDAFESASRAAPLKEPANARQPRAVEESQPKLSMAERATAAILGLGTLGAAGTTGAFAAFNGVGILMGTVPVNPMSVGFVTLAGLGSVLFGMFTRGFGIMAVRGERPKDGI